MYAIAHLAHTLVPELPDVEIYKHAHGADRRAGLDAQVMTVDTLAEDYINNLRHVVDVFAQTLRGQ